ncbi:MAG: hypothetical protein TR69_WS6001000788 [candidate division WS6 bacterium OLB20]|uniref:Uncharacterized protein n=1 Tax=candidate division WS6 bacterium OLB20 TaxID=1617426 RepID=A0A136LYU6_9BACT|nr:MAG: hypothetical protein TR69_WS6001000788 [candidate division WS6 bacterium OLB20]
MTDLNGAEYVFILAVGKIAAIVYMVLLLLTMLVIVRQTVLTSRLIKTGLRVPIMIYALLHVILLFLVLVLTVIVNPAA